MVGSPRKRARREALAAAAGVTLAVKPLERPPAPPQAAPAAPVQPTPPPAPAPKAPVKAEAPADVALAKGLGSSLDQLTVDQFDQLQTLALDFAKEVMEMRLDPGDKNFAKLLGVKQAITTAVLTATTRVRAGDLRGRTADAVAEVLAELKAEEQEKRLSPEEAALFH